MSDSVWKALGPVWAQRRGASQLMEEMATFMEEVLPGAEYGLSLCNTKVDVNVPGYPSPPFSILPGDESVWGRRHYEGWNFDTKGSPREVLAAVRAEVLSRAGEAWDGSQEAFDACGVPAMTVQEVGRRCAAWRLEQFGKVSRLRAAAQVGEEAGEVLRAVGKEEDGIRVETRGLLPEELADVVMSCCAMADEQGIDLEAALRERVARMETLDFRSDPEGGGETVPRVAGRWEKIVPGVYRRPVSGKSGEDAACARMEDDNTWKWTASGATGSGHGRGRDAMKYADESLVRAGWMLE